MELLKSITAELAEKEELEQLEEAGLIKKGLGKLAGAVGMKGKAANLQAQGDADQKIKQLKIAFNQFAGQMGKKMNDASAGDLASFFQSKNLPIADEIKKMANQPLNQTDKAVISKAFQVAVQGGAKRQMRQQAKNPQQEQPQQGQAQQPSGQAQQPSGQGKLGNIAKALASLTPSAQNSLIAALQS